MFEGRSDSAIGFLYCERLGRERLRMKGKGIGRSMNVDECAGSRKVNHNNTTMCRKDLYMVYGEGSIHCCHKSNIPVATRWVLCVVRTVLFV